MFIFFCVKSFGYTFKSVINISFSRFNPETEYKMINLYYFFVILCRYIDKNAIPLLTQRLFYSPIALQPVSKDDPCNPSPCGPHSECRIESGRPVCTCLPNFYGGPPTCHPECTVNSQCSLSLACINKRCEDPCVDACGDRAQCTVQAHKAVCTCPPYLTGDAYTRCVESEYQCCIVLVFSLLVEYAAPLSCIIDTNQEPDSRKSCGNTTREINIIAVWYP